MSAPKQKIYPITPAIDYRKIADAQEFYTEYGFEEIAVPWIINFPAYSATRPPDRPEFYTLGGYLNASGEQSFIELMLNGVKLKKNMCVTACFRDELVIDELRHKYFVKLELIDTAANTAGLVRMVELCRSFFERYIATYVVETGESDGEKTYDIVDSKNKIELGSYGIRHFRHLSWVYGTGVALPRLSWVLKKGDRNVQ